VLVVDVADGFGEIAQIFFFGEGGELGDVAGNCVAVNGGVTSRARSKLVRSEFPSAARKRRSRPSCCRETQFP
jgi:hypothetical protein